MVSKTGRRASKAKKGTTPEQVKDDLLSTDALLEGAKTAIKQGKELTLAGSAQAKEGLDNIIHQANQNPLLRAGIGAALGIGKGLGRIAKASAYLIAGEVKKQSEEGGQIATGLVEAYDRANEAAQIVKEAYVAITDANSTRLDFSQTYQKVYSTAERELTLKNGTGYTRTIEGFKIEIIRSKSEPSILEILKNPRERESLEIIASRADQNATKTCAVKVESYSPEDAAQYLAIIAALEANARKVLAETIKPRQTRHYAAEVKTSIPANGRILNYSVDFEYTEGSIYIHQAPTVKPGVSLYMKSQWQAESNEEKSDSKPGKRKKKNTGTK